MEQIERYILRIISAVDAYQNGAGSVKSLLKDLSELGRGVALAWDEYFEKVMKPRGEESRKFRSEAFEGDQHFLGTEYRRLADGILSRVYDSWNPREQVKAEDNDFRKATRAFIENASRGYTSAKIGEMRGDVKQEEEGYLFALGVLEIYILSVGAVALAEEELKGKAATR